MCVIIQVVCVTMPLAPGPAFQPFSPIILDSKNYPDHAVTLIHFIHAKILYIFSHDLIMYRGTCGSYIVLVIFWQHASMLEWVSVAFKGHSVAQWLRSLCSLSWYVLLSGVVFHTHNSSPSRYANWIAI